MGLSIMQLAVQEAQARQRGDLVEAERLQALRWETAMGLVVNSENTTKPRDPRDPDPTKEGVFQTHNCYRCKDGALPCKKGNPRNCDTLHARND